jgi:uncharacterized UBP type Zn finger protein
MNRESTVLRGPLAHPSNTRRSHMARTRTKTCTHLGEIRDVTPRTPQGCEECLQIGDTWVHLRICMICGHIGCCDNSKNKHATRHFHATNHPIMRSLEPGEDWGWCYPDELFLDAAGWPVRGPTTHAV